MFNSKLNRELILLTFKTVRNKIERKFVSRNLIKYLEI